MYELAITYQMAMVRDNCIKQHANTTDCHKIVKYVSYWYIISTKTDERQRL